PLDKLLEANEENKKLYERLLKAEQDKIEYLEKLLNK
ncbi:MAG: transcriptional regulator, partial [Lutibacter sp.]